MVWEIIDKAEDRKELDEKEKYWIKYYNTYILSPNSNGYNLTIGGQGAPTKEKILNTQKEIDEVLKFFKDCGSIKLCAKKFNCSQSVMRKIIVGEERTEFTGFKDNSFFLQYRRKSNAYTNEQIKEILKMQNEGITNKEIQEKLNIPIKYLQDLKSGRVLSKVNNIPHITREERQKYNPVNSKLTKKEVLEIVELYKNGVSAKEISNLYHINRNRIYDIMNGNSWKEITGIANKSKNIKFLTKDEVLDIVYLNQIGKEIKEIASKYNKKETYIRRILNGDKWNNITHIK